MGYISYPIDSNPFALLQQAYNYIKSRAPQWQEHDGNLDTWILQAVSTQASDLRILATDVPDRIFRYYGDTVLGLHPVDALPAIVTSQWKAIDLKGHLIPAGTGVIIRDGGGEPQGFHTINDYTILPGLSETGVEEVVLLADIPGVAASGIGGADELAELVSPLDWIDQVILADSTSGGVDPETVQQYNDRLADFMRNLSTRPILAEDYARMAKNFPGVYRAVAIDGYDPTNDSFFNEKMITVVGVDQFGIDLPDQIRQDLDDYLEAQREVNFVVWVIDPSRTTINVDFSAVAFRNFNSQEVEAAAEAAVTEYLSPMNWGKDPLITTGGAGKTWVETTWLRYNKLIQVIENVDGVAYVSDMRINRVEDPPNKLDIALDQPAALTEPGTITGSVIVE
jgi:hypothetical protein